MFFEKGKNLSNNQEFKYLGIAIVSQLSFKKSKEKSKCS